MIKHILIKCNILLFFAIININFFLYRKRYDYNQYYSCIVIRIDNVTFSQISRYLSWKKKFPKQYDFFLLSNNKINSSLLYNCSIVNIVISFKEIQLIYPNITHLNGNCSSFKSPKLLSWISHSESIVIFYKKLRNAYKYIWIIEQDVGYSGNLYQFIKLYDNNVKDFISINKGKITPKWVWFNCATDKYIQRRLKYFSNNYGYANREYIQRWSKLYISKMAFDLNNNYHSQSETSSIETAIYHNLSYELISKSYIGSPLCACKSISKMRWNNISNNILYLNKFYHPLKF